jgi:hypothetical protein
LEEPEPESKILTALLPELNVPCWELTQCLQVLNPQRRKFIEVILLTLHSVAAEPLKPLLDTELII